jgi:anhydro-N-acetylmuramic acid kinase
VEKFTAIGIMSGSSLDGVDIALCSFILNHGKWSFEIKKAKTYPYSEAWKLKLQELPGRKKADIASDDIEYGKLLGSLVHDFLKDTPEKPDLIASHGHTIFHEPEKGYTLQIGDGQAIADTMGILTVSNFRQKDIDLGGQGAPLVPIGDKLLFSNYDFCLNIGGIANISYEENGQLVAFDVCPANQLLNYLSRQTGVPYDKGGAIAQLGKLDKKLFDQLNKDDYYGKEKPKSLSNQYVTGAFISRLELSDTPVEDKLYTVVKHIAWQIKQSIAHLPKGKLLITGGGAHNHFLVKAIELETGIAAIVPGKEIVNFKEALIFALMGVLRITNENNCLASVTGAKKDSCCGDIHYPDDHKKT